jgi:predicted dehydrogenase
MSDSQNESARIGAVVVGTGFGVLTHARAMRHAGIEIHALVGRDPEKTRERAKRINVPHGLTSLSEALALPGVDLVAIATPPHTHAAIALEAIAAGKHIVCEKPFARNIEEAEQMLAAAERAGIVHFLGTEFRFQTTQSLATRAVKQGMIGVPKLATLIMNVPVLADPAGEVPSWWGDAADGGGWLGAYASHIIDQLRMTVGEMSGVSASVSLLSDRDWSADDTYTIHFRTREGCEGVLQSTAGGWGPPVVCTRFYGSKGTVSVQGNDVLLSDASGTRVLDVPEDLVTLPPEPAPADLMTTTYDHLHAGGFDVGPYTRLFELMCERIRGGSLPNDPAPATFADGVAGQRILDAVRLSSREKRWVDIL